MSLESLTSTEQVEVLVQSVTQGASLGTNRDFVTTGRFLDCHAHRYTAGELERLRLRQMDVSHKISFHEDPLIDERNRLKLNGQILRLKGPVINAHGLGRLWTVDCIDIGIDQDG